MTRILHDRAMVLKLGKPAAMVGAGAMLLTLVLGILNRTGLYPRADPGQFFRSYLFAWLFWVGVSLGAMAILMLYHCTGGDWGRLVARLAEHAAMVLPLMILLFFPLCFGLKYLYPWADPQRLADDPILKMRHAYLNGPWFIARSLIYLVCLSMVAFCLRSWSLARDIDPSAVYGSRMSRLSAGGLLLYFLVMTLASVDWVMSRELHWYSSVYGFITVIAQVVAGFSFLLVMIGFLAESSPFDTAVKPNLLNDEGNLLLTLVILWAYLSLAQFLVVWMSNLQGDITWYIHRTHRYWKHLAVALILGHFFIPFAMLLKQSCKRDIRILSGIAIGLFVLQALDTAWMVLPSSTTKLPNVTSWMDVTAFFGIGGFWFAAFLFLVNDHPLMSAPVAVSETTISHGEHSTSSPLG